MQEYLGAGGIVMIPLVFASLAMWTLILQRTLFLRRLHHKNMTREQAAVCLRENTIPEPGARRGATALLVTEFMKRRSGRRAVDRFILDETVMALVSSFDRHLAVIGVLAGAAPLLGLLGTVTGMIATFDSISLYGTGNARAMAAGISEALITTQTGLLMAIPGLYMRNFLTRRAENLKRRIASVGIYLKRHV